MAAQGLAGGRGLQVRQAPLEDVFLAVTLQAELEHAQVGQHPLLPLPRRSSFLLAFGSLRIPTADLSSPAQEHSEWTNR